MKRMLFLLLPALVPGSALAQLVISEIDLAANQVELVNSGETSVNISGYFWCNRLSGSPFYPAVSAATIDAGNSETSTLEIGPGEWVTFTLGESFITDASGELGLYTTNSFGSSTAIVDYVGWGADGVRDSVASSAGIWASGTFVDVAAIQAGETIQLKQSLPGNGKDDYELAASTIGVNQVDPPGPVEVTVTDLSRSGSSLIIAFTGPAGISPDSWQVFGSVDLAGFGDDRSGDTTVVENPVDSGSYEAVIDLADAGPSYFVRIVLPE